MERAFAVDSVAGRRLVVPPHFLLAGGLIRSEPEDDWPDGKEGYAVIFVSALSHLGSASAFWKHPQFSFTGPSFRQEYASMAGRGLASWKFGATGIVVCFPPVALKL